jgi:hypothetical protein
MIFIQIIVFSSCTTAQIPKDFDLELVPHIVSVQDITFSFDTNGEIINFSEEAIEAFLIGNLSEINDMVLDAYDIVLDEEEFLNMHKKYPLMTVFKPTDHYMRKWYSWISEDIADFRSKITIYDSLGSVRVAVDIHKGGSREFPEYFISLPIEFNLPIKR